MNENYLSRSKQQTLQVFLAVLGGGISGRSFADLAADLYLSESALLKELHNLAAAGYAERRTDSRFWAVSPHFIERFATVIKSLGIEVK
ncbi:hypothetical protein P0082_01000 [Candidatus Haliotispira prima]|uniref:Uncharacterized protein n=1 Tax=Candidatus Haliotispira prima TaxID=3034016 RepID=A0ABY8MHP6_9SPIO|nr:hypothetical protein P0082_01000 [Candidatus Haliotispira prima]